MRKILVALGVGMLACGCSNNLAISEDNAYSDKYAGIEAGRLFIAPVRLHYNGLESGGDKVIKEMAKQLKNCGWDVATMSQENYQSVWSEITRSIDGIYSPSTGQLVTEKYQYALRELVESINDGEGFSAALIPRIVLKRAEIKGGIAHWDGVKRKKITSNLPGAAWTSWSGSTRGLSLEVMAFDSESAWLFTNYGGLVLPFHTTIRDGKPANEIRDKIFDDDLDIESGVGVALHSITNGKAMRAQSRRGGS